MARKKNLSNEALKDMHAFTSALKLWTSIESFLKRMVIKEGDEKKYEKELETFVENVKKFYRFGGKSFLNNENHIGWFETTYMHALRFYMPQFTKHTWKEHKLPLGIYTMQGFERRNKLSKNVFHKHSNAKHNLCMQTLRMLLACFLYE